MMRICCGLLLFSAFAAASASSPSPDPKTLIVPQTELSRARELVQLLGSEHFPDRERAEAELSKMGRLARPALLEAVNTDPNAEVRYRCNGLLPRANSLEMRARLDVFLADTDGKYEHDLPGWNQFRTLVRNEWDILGYRIFSDHALDKAAREVFADLLSTQVNRSIVMAAGGSEAELGQLTAARRQELYNAKYGRTFVAGGVVTTTPAQRRDPTVADLTTLLFTESLVPSRLMPRATSMSILLSSSGFTAAASGNDDKSRVYRAVAVAWLDTRNDPIEMSQAISLASSLGSPDQACRIAVRLLNAKGALISYRGNAAATLARLGNKTHIPLMEKLHGDNGVIYTIRRSVFKDGKNELETFEVQLRDVALAVCVLLSGQKLEDFGFVDQFPGNGVSYSYTRAYFPDEAKRKAAFDKWNEWRAKNP